MTPDDVLAAAEQLVDFHGRFAPLFGKDQAEGKGVGPEELDAPMFRSPCFALLYEMRYRWTLRTMRNL